MKVEGENKVLVRTTLEDHRRINRIQSGKSKSISTPAVEKRYTLRVEKKPVGPLLRLLASRMDMQIEFPAPYRTWC